MVPPTTQETASLILRPLVWEDREVLAGLMGHPDMLRSLALRPQQGEREGIETFLRGVLHSHESGGPLSVFAMTRRQDGIFVGTCGLVSEADPSRVEFFCAVLPWFQGKGYASEAAERLIAEAFSSEGVTEVVAHIEPDNAAPIRILERLGFRDRGLTDHPLSPEKLRFFVLSRPS